MQIIADKGEVRLRSSAVPFGSSSLQTMPKCSWARARTWKTCAWWYKGKRPRGLEAERSARWPGSVYLLEPRDLQTGTEGRRLLTRPPPRWFIVDITDKDRVSSNFCNSFPQVFPAQQLCGRLRVPPPPPGLLSVDVVWFHRCPAESSLSLLCFSLTDQWRNLLWGGDHIGNRREEPQFI